MKITKEQLKQIIKEELELAKLQPTIDSIFALVTKEIEKNPSETQGIIWSTLMSKIAEAAKDAGSDDSAIEEAFRMYEEENNPWAICTAQVGREDKEKYEKCVKSVKKKNGGE